MAKGLSETHVAADATESTSPRCPRQEEVIAELASSCRKCAGVSSCRITSTFSSPSWATCSVALFSEL